MRERLLPLLEEPTEDAGPWPWLLLEPTAGQGTSLCSRAEDLAAYFAALEHHPRLGVCLDTCHAHAGGNPLETVVADVLAITGRIDLVHCNDSRDDFDSGADRHANFGAGRIDPDLLAAVVRDAGAPVVCETPGPVEAHVADLQDALGLVVYFFIAQAVLGI